MRTAWMGLLIGLFAAGALPLVADDAQAMGSNGGKKEPVVQSSGQTMDEDSGVEDEQEMEEGEATEEVESEDAE